MGVPASECEIVAELVAIKTIVNEFAAYSRLAEYISKGIISVKKRHIILKYMADGTFHSLFDEQKRSETIATYALCGFSNISSVGIQIGALASMAPERQSDLSQVAFRALIAGCAACFMTACIAGIIYNSIKFI